MTDSGQKLLPRLRYGVIQPRAHEDVQRARSYQLYRLLPLDIIEISTGLGLEIYGGRRRAAIKNYRTCRRCAHIKAKPIPIVPTI